MLAFGVAKDERFLSTDFWFDQRGLLRSFYFKGILEQWVLSVSYSMCDLKKWYAFDQPESNAE